ncbi:MAG TPA: hypothetical protein VGV38_22580 [Pyrinomonadaceae bacterium]|nr:hypothetical protein [Pyrinomonadaceae bacterium]
MREPYIAAVLSLIVPGVGQFYNGQMLAGALWLVALVTIIPGFWLGTGGILGLLAHLIAAYTAYAYAKEHRVRT